MKRANMIDDADVCGIVNRWVAKYRSEQQAANAAGITRQALNAQLNGDKRFSPSVLRAAGIRRVVSEHYELIEG